MTDKIWTQDEIIHIVARLDPPRLERFVAARLVQPARGPDGHLRFGPFDRARLEFLCEMAEDFDLEEEALAIILSLVDQLHQARADLARLAAAIDAEPEETRRRIGSALCR